MKVITCADCPYCVLIKDINVGRCIINNTLVFTDTKVNCYYFNDYTKYKITQIVFGFYTYYGTQVFLDRGGFLVSMFNNVNNTYDNIRNIINNIIQKDTMKVNRQLILIGFVDTYGVGHKRTELLNDAEFVSIFDTLKQNRMLRVCRYITNIDDEVRDEGQYNSSTGEITK